MKTLIFIFMTFLLFVANLAAKTIKVPSEQPTIQAGIDFAVDGDMVLVASGSYSGDGNRNLDFNGKAITVISEQGPVQTIVDCYYYFGSDGARFHSGEGANSILSGFWFIRSVTAISCSYHSSPTIENCIMHAKSDNAWTGIFCDHSSPTFKNCIIADTYNPGCGGAGGITLRSSSPVIENCIITRNGNWDSPGGISCSDNSSPYIKNCTISHNYGFGAGGGIYAFDGSSPVIEDCVISDNFIEWGGGGISCSDSTKLINCIITRNHSLRYGGGISCSDYTVISNCLIYDNVADIAGGGIDWSHSYGKIENSTITGNIAGDHGGGIITNGISPSIINCILWGDIPDEIFADSSAIHVSYSDIQGGWQGIGNIDNDPLFRSSKFKNFAFLLLPNSPCIDSGDPQIYDRLYEWHPKWPKWFPDEARSDMGAYGGPGNIGWLK